MDDKSEMAYALLGLGLVGLAAPQEVPEARGHILHSLRLRQEIGEQHFLTSSLVGAAGLALHEGDALRAAQLLGAVASALQAIHAVLEPDVMHFHAHTLAAAQAALGAAAFQAAWAAGERWSLDETVRVALARAA